MAAPGPYLAPHVLIKWGGTLPGNEEWSCQVRMGRVGAGPWPDITSGATAPALGWANAVTAFHTNGSARIGSSALITYIKVNMIGVDGKYALANTNTRNIVPNPGGGSAAPIYPNQVSLAVTFKTAFARGPGHNTRIFLPIPNPLIQTDGRISASDATSIKGAALDFTAALNAVSPLYVLSVFSRVAGAPTQRPVTTCVVGRVFDTQQRRRAALPESYV